MRGNPSPTMSWSLRSTNSPPKSKSSAAKFAWARLPCRRWATSPFVRTRKTTSSPFGNETRKRNRHAKDHPVSVVRWQGGGGSEVLLLHLQELKDRNGCPLRRSRGGRLGTTQG